MGTTQPIRSKEDLRVFLEFYEKVEPSERNCALLSIGIHTALRISDILKLRWKDLYDFEKAEYRTHVCVCEKKTGKRNMVALNPHVKEVLNVYQNSRNTAPEDFVFTKDTNYSSPLSRSQAYRIVRHAAWEALHAENISCHSLRKTFGYHAWKQGTAPALLMNIFNHSSYEITKKYLGIDQDEKDDIFLSFDILDS